MFFDCTGLLAGLAASVITKWKANDKYSYGYVRAEVIAGFVNSLFLLFIAFFIMSEAVERAIEPPEVSSLFKKVKSLRQRPIQIFFLAVCVDSFLFFVELPKLRSPRLSKI